MAIIECDDIEQTISQMYASFQSCSNVKKTDLIKLLDLITAVNNCGTPGVSYDTLISNLYEPVSNQVITYPINTFNSISLVILDGSIIYNSITLPTGTSINIPFTNLNQTPFVFTAVAGSKILVEYVTINP
jgi:hypothetical protein